MKFQLDCVPCLQRQALQAVRFVSDDPDLQEKVLREVMTLLEGRPWIGPPTDTASLIHRKVRELTGVADPYLEKKQEATQHALRLYPRLKQRVTEATDPLSLGVKLAIIGNVIDLGALSSYDIEKTMKERIDQPIAINHSEHLDSLLLRTNGSTSSTGPLSIVWFADNAGETVFDRVLLETIIDLQERAGRKVERITYVVKGGPVVNDATLDDAKEAGLEEVPGLSFKVVSNGEEDKGPPRNGEEVRSWLAEHDLAIAKGQANYEAMNELPGIHFLFLAKCPLVATDLGVQIGGMVVWYSGAGVSRT
jgi:uncharacterized protein with ATP-grasp and redox domains